MRREDFSFVIGMELQETEARIKELKRKLTIRCIPFDAEEEEGKCMVTGKPSHRRVLIARAY